MELLARKYQIVVVAVILVTSLTLLIHKTRNFDSYPGPVESDEIEAMDQSDPKLIKIIREKYLQAPSTGKYQLVSSLERETSMGQAQAVKTILGDNFRDGFFVECGALDGETRSNSLNFERLLGWRGLLVEADPSNYKLVLQKNRNAWSSGVCLSTKPFANKVLYHPQFNIGKIYSEGKGSGHKPYGTIEVQCLPIYSLLLALNQTTVDYFSLDVEGFELEVLKTVPWHKVNIRVLSVEFAHVPEGKEDLKNFMKAVGYWVHSEVTAAGSLANDFIFVKESFMSPPL